MFFFKTFSFYDLITFWLTNTSQNLILVFSLLFGKFNYLSYLFFYSCKSIPVIPGLQNSLFNVHPLLFFVSIVFCIKNNKFTHYSYYFIALFLGGFWAAQEFNWGGWWNWDTIETPTLVLSTITLVHLHLNKNKTLTITTSANVLKSVDFFLAVYLSPKIITTTSIHSFVNFSGFFLLSVLPLSCYSAIIYLFFFSIISFFRVKSIPFFKYFILFYVLSLKKRRSLYHNINVHKVFTLILFYLFLVNINLIKIFTKINTSDYSHYYSCINNSMFFFEKKSLFFYNIVFWKKNLWLNLDNLNLLLEKSTVF